MTRKADLATRTLVELGRGQRLKAGDLAAALGTTTGFVPQVVGPLVRAGWVRSDPGPTGGYSLSVDLDDLSVLDVIEVAEGPTDSGRCVVVDRPCDNTAPCVVHEAWVEARRHLISHLSRTSLSDLEHQ